jgi:hypothetical protein
MGPLPGDQPTVPTQQRARGDQTRSAQLARQQPDQNSEYGAVRPGPAQPGILPPQDGDLVPQHEDLCGLARVTARDQHEPAEDLAQCQVEQAAEHEQ